MDDDYFPWTCPYCDRTATIGYRNSELASHVFDKENKAGPLGFYTQFISCPNSDCREYTLEATIWLGEKRNGFQLRGEEPIQRWQLRPQSNAKPFPQYIPQPIRDDYEEACLIRDLSPKAAATLARRCLQGMIRDFWGISKARLVDEVAELEGKIDQITWDAIDAVRKIGNIGAHMEKDISTIVDVDQDEAKMLLQLIEGLLAEWYIARHDKQAHMQKVIAATQAKSAKKSTP